MKIDEKVKVCFITAFDVELKQRFESSLNETTPSQYGQKNPICFIQKPIEIDEFNKANKGRIEFMRRPVSGIPRTSIVS